MTIVLVFTGAFLIWAITRFLTWPLPELFRRVFWGVVLALLLLPNLVGAGHGQLANTVLWPLAAGLAFAEVGVLWFKDRWLQWQQRRAAKAARQAALATQHDEEVANERRSRSKRD